MFIRLILTIIVIFNFKPLFSQDNIVKFDGQSLSNSPTYFNNSITKKTSAANDYIGIYQKYISGIRGHECPMYPSCSNFGIKTFSETNFASAFILTSDRLMRCGHEHKNYSLTLRTNGFKYIDYPDYDKAPLDLYYSRNQYFFAHSNSNKADSSLLFIKKLINNQYFQEALLEIMRVEFKDTSFNIDLFINKIVCLKAIGEYEKAIFEFDNKCPDLYKSNSALIFEIALIQFKLQNYDQALKLNEIALKENNNEYFKSKILLLNGLLFANKFDWQNAIISYQTLSEISSFEKISKSNLKLAEKASLLKNKKPALAGALSIIPGLGYAYTGHKQTAVTAFLVNGLMGYATYNSFKKQNYGMGILTGVFNLSFYLGNIYGANKSAKRSNEQKRKSIINKLQFNTNL